MIAETKDEMQKTLAAYEELRCEGNKLSFVDNSVGRIVLDLRVEEPHQLVYLARLVAHLGYEETDFAHAHLWITTWGVWNQQVEAIGFKTLEQFRRSFGENRSLESAPGHYFRHNEFQESVCCLLQPMIVGWDAYYVPHWRDGSLDYFVEVSHDSFIDIHVRTEETAKNLREILQSGGWIKSANK
jgi:hypothetical protein